MDSPSAPPLRTVNLCKALQMTQVPRPLDTMLKTWMEAEMKKSAAKEAEVKEARQGLHSMKNVPPGLPSWEAQMKNLNKKNAAQTRELIWAAQEAVSTAEAATKDDSRSRTVRKPKVYRPIHRLQSLVAAADKDDAKADDTPDQATPPETAKTPALPSMGGPAAVQEEIPKHPTWIW